MKILGLIKRNSGPCFHRIMMPLLLMPGVDIHVTNNATPELFERGWDVLYYSREISSDILAEARARKMKVVVDVDDYWKLDYHHIGYDTAQQCDWSNIQITHIRLADLVTTTHERLAELIRPINPNVIVVSNAIPDHEYFTISKSESKLPRIFWQGSITHERDLNIISNPFKRLSKCGIVISGYTKHEAWNKMVNYMTSGLRLPGLILPGLPPHEYYKNYAHADICIAPLLDTKFNALKSNLKALEAAHASLPMVCSGVNPYLDLPALYVMKQGDWFKHLNMLIHDNDARNGMGQKLHDFCKINYNFDKINKTRYAAINA